MNNSIEDIVYNYPNQQPRIPVNRLFYDFGEETILKVIIEGLEASDQKTIKALHFLKDSLLDYRKKSWRLQLKQHLQTYWDQILNLEQYFSRKLLLEILHEVIGNDEELLEGYYAWLEQTFRDLFKLNRDPFLLQSLFHQLDTKYGGTWVYDYQVDMLFGLLRHKSVSMRAIGYECFLSLHADEDEIPAELTALVEELNEFNQIDFFLLRQEFEEHLLQSSQEDYETSQLDQFILKHFMSP